MINNELKFRLQRYILSKYVMCACINSAKQWQKVTNLHHSYYNHAVACYEIYRQCFLDFM